MSTRHIAAEDARLHDLTPEGSSGRASKRFRQKLAADGFTVDDGFKLKPGYLYTVVRAISARVNQNYDGWPSEELKKSYKTFIGKPVFVNHENHDPTKARGVVVAARYVENGMDKYIEVVQEIDAGRFPKLAHEIKTGGLDSVSMGAEAGFTICSYCHNKATDMDDMCDHVLNHKGKTLTRFDKRTGKKEDVLVFESCHKIAFFELSYVFEPADETAVASKVVVAGKDAAVNLSREVPYTGHNIPVSEGNYYRSLNVNSFDDLFDTNGVMRGNGRGGTENLSFMRGAPLEMYTNGITKANTIIEGDSRLPISRTERNGYSFVPQLDRASVDSGATPLRVWQRRAVGDSPIESVHQWEKVYDSFPANSHHAGKYTKEDFAAAGSRKPWEKDGEDESDALEIEAMLHTAGECPPGMDCSRRTPQGEQITKDSPNNPVNQKSSDPNGTGGGLGGAGTPGGGSGGTPDGKGILPNARPLYDTLMKMYPGSNIGGYRVDDYHEHDSGALDFMTTDEAQAAKVREQAFAAGAPYVLWQQKQWNPDGSTSAMNDRGSPTQNHFDHVHIAPIPGGASATGGSSASTGGSSSSSGGGMMQATPTGLVPAQRAAGRFDATVAALVQGGGVQARLSGAKLAAALGSGKVPPHMRGLVGTWIRHNTIKFGPDGKPLYDENGKVIRVPAKPLDPRKPVFVHYNFPAVKAQKDTGVPQPHLWSVEQDGYVRGYTNHLHLVGGTAPDGGVALNVQKSGADKAMRTEVRNVHAGAEGFLAPVDDRGPLPFSKINYDPFRKYDPKAGTNFFYHEDDYDTPVTSADEMHFSQYAQMHGFQADNWGRPGEPQLVFPPPPDLNASNPDTVRPDIVEQAKLRGQKPSQRSAALKKIARARAMRLAWGETEAPMAVDTLREEGSAPEDDNDDFERYVDPPKELQTPDLSQAQQVDREQELSGATPDQMGGVPGQADPMAAAQPQQPQQQYMTLQIPMPAEAPQVPQAAVPPQAQLPPQQPQMPVTASMLDYFDRYYGRRVANWMDAIEAGRDMTPAEAADYRRQAGKLSTLENGREHSTTNRNPTKGTATMARSTIASRSKVARAGRRQHLADGPLVDGGDRSRNDQGEQEEAFISQTPPETSGDYPTDDSNIHNSEHNLVARVQRGREQLLRDAKALAAVQRKRALSEAGGPTAEVVDPRVQTGPEGEALTGTNFVSADPNDGVKETQPKDASLKAFAAFDSWLAQKTGKSSRRHSEANIKKAAAQFSREAGISPQALFPALGIVLREARKNDKQANTKGAKMRKRSNESLDVAAPDGRVDVEAPVSNTTDAEAQASQFDLHDFGNNAGDNVANPDLSTDQNWAPGEASKKASIKTAGGLLAMRCAEGMIAAGLEPNSRERKYQLAAEFETMNRGLIQDRVALLERFAAVRQADLRRVASGSSRGAARSPIPAGLGGGTRTASAGQRLAAHDPSNDSGLFI